MNANVIVFIVIGMLIAAFSSHIVVCDVDPSDIDSILLGHLKVQNEQLALDEVLQAKQSLQLETQKQQLELLKQILNKANENIPMMEILVSVTCAAFGLVALLFLRKFVVYLYLRYNIRPEMPQTTELMDSAQPSQLGVEHLRSVQPMKSPTTLSRESGDE